MKDLASVGYADLQQIGQFQHELFALFPAEASVGNALAVGALADLLVAVLDVALDHHALDERVDVIRVALGVQDLLRDADLLQILLAGVGVVAVDNAGGVLDAISRKTMLRRGNQIPDWWKNICAVLNTTSPATGISYPKEVP